MPGTFAITFVIHRPHSAALNWHQRNAFPIFFGATALIVLAAILWWHGGTAWPTAADTLLLRTGVLQTTFGCARQRALGVLLGVALFGLVLAPLFDASGGRARGQARSPPNGRA